MGVLLVRIASFYFIKNNEHIVAYPVHRIFLKLNSWIDCFMQALYCVLHW